MHWILSFLVAVALLAGCTSPPAEAPAPPADDGPDRTARKLTGTDEEVPTEPVELLRTALTMAGPGPESFELTVPEDVHSVDFHMESSTTAWTEVDLRVELSGCGTYERAGAGASAGGSGPSNQICGTAEPGPQTVTLSAALLVFDGTLIVSANVLLLGNATA